MILPIDVALRRIKKKINIDVLCRAFNTTRAGLDYAITNSVIQESVIPDCSMYGGKIKGIILRPEWVEITTGPNAYGTYRIPLEARESRTIVDVADVGFPVQSANSHYPDHNPAFGMHVVGGGCGVVGWGQFQGAADAMHRSKTVPSDNVPVGEVVGNMILLHPAPNMFVEYEVSVKLGYDSEMTNLNSAALSPFADMCLTAVKQYCYNALYLSFDDVAIRTGMSLPKLTDYINAWSDLDSEEEEHLDAFVSATRADFQTFLANVKKQI